MTTLEMMEALGFPADEEKASLEGRLGDLNSITGIAFSNKDKSKENN